MSRHSIHIPDDATIPTEPSEDEWYGLLASGRRRAVLEVVLDRPGPAGVDDVARAVAALEAGRSEPTASAVRTVAISLYHADLPRLADSGLLVYDAERDRVEPTRALLDSAVGR